MLSVLSKRYLRPVIAASALAIAGCASTPLPVEDTAWPTHLGDFARTGVSSTSVDVPLEPGWKKGISEFSFLSHFPDEQLSSPALSKGRLYAGSTAGVLYATDLASGKVLWKFDAGRPLEAPPTVTGNSVCFGASDGAVRCLDLEGRQMWQFQARSEVVSSPAVKDSRLFFASSDDRLYALDANTGERLWTYSRPTYRTVTKRMHSSPALSESGHVFHLFSDGTASCVSASTGTEVWSKKVAGEFTGATEPRRTPLVDSGVVYLIDSNLSVVALSVNNGEVKGIYSVIKASNFLVPDSRSIVIAGEGQVMSIDRATGAVIWRSELAHKAPAALISVGDRLFVFSNFKKAPFGIEYFAKDTGYIESFDLKDGKRTWAMELGSSVTAGPSAALGRISFLANDGTLTVLKPGRP